MGPCLCGDPYCRVCGSPEQAAFEEVCEYLDDLFDDCPQPVAREWLTEYVANAVNNSGHQPLIDALYAAAKEKGEERRRKWRELRRLP